MVVALTVLVLAAGCGTGGVPDAGPAPVPPGVTGFDAATRDDPEFDGTFRHGFADVDGVRMHYVAGGTGPPVVLLHGWPQSWYAWWPIMPALAEHHTVYAVDLPGLGDSEGVPTGYDKATLARYVHGLVADHLRLREVRVVGHDLGAGAGFRYAAQYPDEVLRYAHLAYPLPGPALSAARYRTFSWHIAFHTKRVVPEAVVADDVREYLSLFYAQVALDGESFGGSRTAPPFDEREIDEFTRTYSRPQVLSGGFELYRALDRDERDNTAAAPVPTPTMLMTAQGLLESTRPSVESRLPNLVRAVEVPGSGHRLPEENPGFVLTELLTFLS